MPRKRLSQEIVSLIHHVELNESGWWKKAVGQVIRGVLWKSDASRTLAELSVDLNKEIGITLADDVLLRQLDTLQSQGVVTRLPGPNFKLTEKARQELSDANQKAKAEQVQCRADFSSACKQNCPELAPDTVWRKFESALRSAVQVTGANLFHLLADGKLERDVDWLTLFLSKFDAAHSEGLKRVVSAFFAPENQACRNQVLRLMSAHFFAEAAQLRPETLSAIEGERKKKSIKVVLDTNFIFSALNLHENPGDDAVLSLLDLAQKSERHLEIKLYVLPSTLQEAQRVLLDQLHRVQRIRATPMMARVAVSHSLPSIARKFLDAAARSPGLTAESFFAPYIDDLRTVLRDRGIAVLEAHPSVYKKRQDVIDDVLDEQKREEQELPENKRKGYETLLHDAVLWHAVKDRRPADADSPFEAEYWAVSVDWRLVAFDRQKRYANASNLPVVLHPSNLVQLVQFWVPRSAVLDESLIDSIRLPLFFQSFDPEDEKATVKVLEAISRFENVGDIPEKTLKVILANQVLRSRIKDVDASNDEAFELVREELLAMHHTAVQTLEHTEATLTSTTTSLEQERRLREATDQSFKQVSIELNEIKSQAADAARKAKEAEQRAAAAEKAKKDYEDNVALELTRRDEVIAAANKSMVRQRYVAGVLIMPLAVGGALGAWAYGALPRMLTVSFPQITLGSGVAPAGALALGISPIAIALLVSPHLTKKFPALQNWWVTRFANFVGKKAIAGPILVTLSAIYQGGAWDWFKSTLNINL